MQLNVKIRNDLVKRVFESDTLGVTNDEHLS